MAKKTELMEKIEVQQGTEVRIEGTSLSLKGPKGTSARNFYYPGLNLSFSGNLITITMKGDTKREQKLIGTIKAHIRNMMKGVAEGHSYLMKICSGHFPMHVSVSGNEFIIKNFFGERHPRKLRIRDGVKIKIDGSDILLEGVDKEFVSQTAADIEQLTRRTKYDRRVFQDGIYITSKDGKEIR